MRVRSIACLLITLAACGVDEDPALEPRATDPTPSPIATDPARSAVATEKPDDTPHLSITDPTDGSEVAAGDVTVAVSVRNFDVVNKLKLGEAPVDGEGHIHYYLDVDEIPTAAGQHAGGRRRFDAGTYRAVGTTTYTWPDVGQGTHTFAAQLFQNGHTPLEPPVVDEVSVSVR